MMAGIRYRPQTSVDRVAGGVRTLLILAVVGCHAPPRSARAAMCGSALASSEHSKLPPSIPMIVLSLSVPADVRKVRAEVQPSGVDLASEVGFDYVALAEDGPKMPIEESRTVVWVTYERDGIEEAEKLCFSGPWAEGRSHRLRILPMHGHPDGAEPRLTVRWHGHGDLTVRPCSP